MLPQVTTQHGTDRPACSEADTAVNGLSLAGQGGGEIAPNQLDGNRVKGTKGGRVQTLGEYQDPQTRTWLYRLYALPR